MSLTPNIELYKHDNVTTNTNQFDIDKALNKNWDKIDNEIGELQATVTAFDFKGNVDTLANIQAKPKLKGDVWYCTANSTYYACNGTNWIPVNVGMDLNYVNNIKAKTIQCLQQLETPTPVIGENITLNDCKKGKFKSFGLRGNSEQEKALEYGVLESGSVYQGNNAVMNNRVRTSKMIDVSSCSKVCVNAIGAELYLIVKYDNNNNYLSDTLWNNIGTVVELEDNVSAIRVILRKQDNTDINVSDISNFSINSPGSNFEVPIKSCGDNINLYNKDDSNAENGYLTTTGTVTANNDHKVTDFIKVLGFKNITISGNKGNNEVIAFYDKNKTFLSYISMTTNKTKVLDIPNNAYYIRATVHNTASSSYKIEKGKVATPYSKFGEGNINVTVSDKDIFDKNSAGTLQGYFIDTSTTIYSSSVSKCAYFPITPGKHYIVRKKEGKRFNIATTASIPTANMTIIDNAKNINSSNVQKQRTKLEITASNNANYLVVWYYSSDADTLSDAELFNSIKITTEEQNISIPTQKPFRSIGDIRDTFIKKGGKNYECHKIKRIIFDGTENFNIVNNETNWKQFRTYLADLNLKGEKILSNYFNYSGLSETFAQKLEAVTFDTNKNVRFSFKSETMTLADFKAMLAQKYAEGHPMYIDYVLAEPELIACTEEQNAILSDIEDHLETYDDVTHIYSTDEVAPNFEVTYCKDVQKLFNNIAI